ncbi:Phospholipase [Mycena chlorophos]|uniref:phospholipase D n=1 Tax=Mycena chlorophos TaxID=658473 RepID=A0A8H6TCV9_MYCCL|nr:Phospholipase [Mycena chlorophos]
MTIQYHIQDLLELVSQYQKPLNPAFQQLDQRFVQWVDSTGFLSERHKKVGKAWKQAELPLLIARIFPEADGVHLQTCLEFMMSFLILEQLTDTPATTETARKWAAEFVDALQHANSDVPAPPKEGPAAVLQQLSKKVMGAIDPPYRAAYIASNILLSEGVVQEAIDRESGVEQTSLETYVQTRRKSIGAMPFHALDLWISKLDIPDEVLKNPHLQEMVDGAVDLVALANDVYSYRKEYLEDGAKHNFVTVAMHDPGTGIKPGEIQAAIDYTVERFKATLSRLEELKRTLPSLDAPGLGPKLERYAELMMDSVAGNIEWSVTWVAMSFFNKLANLAERLPEGIHHARDEMIGILNPNRRHDDPEEKRQDAIRAEINASHRFGSFATERGENTVKWHIDGHDYFWAVSELLDNAKECIFILDWWLTPELYLRRPPALYPEWRLDRLLKRKAEQGVKVLVIVYKEVTQTMTMSSKHTKSWLEGLHPSIVCMRHPDHIGSKGALKPSIRLNSGRITRRSLLSTTITPALVDWISASGAGTLIRILSPMCTQPTFHALCFLARITTMLESVTNSDFQTVYNYASNALSSLESGRMPWHDVHMTITGPSVLDIAQHFIERWNEVKKRKYRDKPHVPWLALPHDVENAPNEAVVRHPHREAWLKIGHQTKQRFLGRPDGDEEWAAHYARKRIPGMLVQVVRSVSDWSHGVLTEHSIQNAYCQLIRESEHFIYIENQFFISATNHTDVVKNQIAAALVERIVRAARKGQKFHVVVVIPEVPGFAGTVKDESSLKTIMAAQYRTINRGGHSIYEEIRKAGYEPMDYIRFYHLRAYDRINAPLSTYIEQIERLSGVKYHDVLVALARKWIGPAVEEGDQHSVTFTIPAEVTEGPAKPAPKTETVPIPASEEEADDVIRRFEEAAKQIRGDEDVSDNVAQHMLHDRTSLLDEKWLGTPKEELDAYVSEVLYIHTKLMIVDDRRVIMGSANLNDRSQRGDGDSEIALVVEDWSDMVDSTMDGRPYEVTRFAASLRRKLWREHLGLMPPQSATPHDHRPTPFMRPVPHPNPNEMSDPEDALVADPLASTTLDLWNTTARQNREIFTEIFRVVPTNLIRSFSAWDVYVPKVKPGHVAPDVPLERVKNRLALVKGSLVEMPLDFLSDQADFVEGPDWRGLNPTLPIYI